MSWQFPKCPRFPHATFPLCVWMNILLAKNMNKSKKRPHYVVLHSIHKCWAFALVDLKADMDGPMISSSLLQNATRGFLSYHLGKVGELGTNPTKCLEIGRCVVNNKIWPWGESSLKVKHKKASHLGWALCGFCVLKCGWMIKGQFRLRWRGSP